jgi:hypothetical protein
MKQYVYRARLTFDGAMILVEAEDEADADEKFKRGEFHLDSYGELVDYEGEVIHVEELT